MDIPTYNVVSLCSGGGGLDLGLDFAIRYYGGKTVTQCYVERELYAASILAQRMEEGHICTAPIWSDVKTFADEVGADLQGKVDILTGGYPCQPFSVAGAQKGTDDPRHLWPDICRIIRTVRPIWCFFENVEGHVGIGFDEVVKDLHGLGYAVEAGLFTASEVGATHRRKRLFILAFAVGLADGKGEQRGSGFFQKIDKREESEPSNWNILRDRPGPSGVPVMGNAKSGEHSGEQEAQGTGKQRINRISGENVADSQSINGGLQLSAGQQGKVDPEDSGSSEDVEHATKQGLEGAAGQSIQGGSDGLAVTGRISTGVGQADSCKSGSQRCERAEPLKERHREKTLRPVTEFCLPLFPPPPNDDRGWAEVLNIQPEVKPAIRELDDELAPVLEHRRDALRLLGNGVVPTQAAYAFITLAQRFG